MSYSNQIDGQCHCGNLSFQLRTNKTLEALGPRECDCSFCRSQASKCVSDPEGAGEVVVRDPSKLLRYQFGMNSIEFFLCGQCGGYLGGVMEDDEGWLATLNLRLTQFHDVPGQSISYGNEDRSGRNARRRDRWTPVELKLG